MAKKITVLFVVLAVFVVGITALGLGTETTEAQAGTPKKVTGWAWSSNIGWIHFNPTGGGSDVHYNDSSGVASGHAWSSNIGWIDFTGTQIPLSETFNQQSGYMTGWANAIAGDSISNDGWDGKIKMSDPTWTPDGNGYRGVARVGNKLLGYAWGSEVVGWVDFNPSLSGEGGPCNPDIEVCVDGGTSLSVSCSVSPSSATLSGNPPSADATWTATASGGSGNYSYLWGGNLAGVTINPKTKTYTAAGTYQAKVTAIDITNGDSVGPTDCSNVLNICPVGQTWSDLDDDGVFSCTGTPPGGGDGTLTLVGGATTIISTQGSSPAASKPFLQIKNEGETAVDNISVTSNKTLDYQCSLSTERTTPNWKDCSSLGSIPATGSAWFSVRIEKYDKDVSQNSPYRLTMTGKSGGTDVSLKKKENDGSLVSTPIIFEYLVGGVDPR